MPAGWAQSFPFHSRGRESALPTPRSSLPVRVGPGGLPEAGPLSFYPLPFSACLFKICHYGNCHADQSV